MQITIDIPDQHVTDALAAATRMNQRLPEATRQPEPLTFGAKETTEITVTWLTNIILTDLAQAAQRAAEQAANDKRDAIQALVTGTP